MKYISNTKECGFTVIEVLLCVAVACLLLGLGIATMGKYSNNANRQAARAGLSHYYGYAKTTIAEFGCNPGNFVSLGFNPVGEVEHRIVSQHNACSSANIPKTFETILEEGEECVTTFYGRIYYETSGVVNADIKNDGYQCTYNYTSANGIKYNYYFPQWTESANLSNPSQTGCPGPGSASNDGSSFRTLACYKEHASDADADTKVFCICHNKNIGFGDDCDNADC